MMIQYIRGTILIGCSKKWKNILYFSQREIIPMNTNNSAFTKLENGLLDKMATPSGKDEKDLYESVLHRHYQIIQTFLEKINSLYIKNQEFEMTLNTIQDRLDKIETTNSNIHYEFRTTHLMMDKRLNSIMSDYTNMNEQIKLIRHQIPADSYLSTQQHLLAKSAFLKNRGAKHRRKLQSSGSLMPKVVVTEAGKQIREHKQSKIESSLNLGEERLLKSLHRVSQTCKVIFPQKIATPMESQSETQSKQEISYQQEGELCDEQEEKSESRSEKFGVVYDKQWVENQISRHMDQFNTRMNIITQQWNEEKTQIKSQIFGPETQQYFNAFQLKMDEKITQLKDMINGQNEKIKKQIDYVNETSLKNIGALQYKLAQKVQNRFFEQSMNNLSSAISIQLANNQKYYSNKQQTQRAIRFLQNKINKIIEEEDNINTSTIMKSSKETKPEQEPYLRINKCISQKSQKKVDLSGSQNNIAKNIEAETNPRSLNVSSSDLQKYEKCISFKECKQNVAPVEPKKLNWKPISSSDKLDACNIQSEAKIRKASISRMASPEKHRSSYSNFMPQERVNQKQWREKVVKILKAGDRKRVKVTFHS